MQGPAFRTILICMVFLLRSSFVLVPLVVSLDLIFIYDERRRLV